MKRLSKSGIEYLDYAWNFYSGCENWRNPRICPVGSNCWAKGITKRFPDHYPNGFKPTFYPEAFGSPLSLKKPSTIGVCFMGDLFGDWVDPNSIPAPDDKYEYWISLKNYIFETIRACLQHTFLFLTKCPWNLAKWSFPSNCWVGVSTTNERQELQAILFLDDISAGAKYLSFEPLLGRLYTDMDDFKDRIDWVIIGSQTRPTILPDRIWVDEIIEAADGAGIKVFLKNSLALLFPEGLRQEIP